MPMIIQNVEVWNAHEKPKKDTLFIENQLFVEDMKSNHHDIIDGDALFAVPGFVDLHIHGAMGGDVMDATQEGLEAIAKALAAEGTTAFLATTMTQSAQQIENALQNAADFSSDYSQLVGIHLEGPFVNRLRAGAQPVQYIRQPDIALFRKWHEISNGKIKYITIAPELAADHFIEELVSLDVIVSAGHTDATSLELRHAQQKGVRSVTHLYNQMKPFHHREIGAIGEALLNDGLYCELIADFVHTSREAVQFALKAKGPDRVFLITDAMRAKGLEKGIYDLGGQHVMVDQDARLEDGTVAGSILKMNVAVKNVSTLCTPQELVKISSYNANRLLKREGHGVIAPGYFADIVLLDKDFTVKYTIINGKIVYSAND